MNRRTLLSLGLTLSFPLGLVAPAAQDPAPPASVSQEAEERSLTRQRPLPGAQEEPDALGKVLGSNFDPARWTELLTTGDLAGRERNFDRIVKRALLDPSARAFLVERAADDARPELAWTARLALREIERRNRPFATLLPMGHTPGDNPLQGILQLLPEGARPGGGMRMVLPGGASGRSVSLQTTPEGAVLRITENVEGQEQTRRYEGESLEAILEANPKLSQELGMSARDQNGGLELHLGLPGSAWTGLLGPNHYGELDDRALVERVQKRGGVGRFFSPQAPSEPMRTDVLGVKVRQVGPEYAERLGITANAGLLVVSVHPRTIAHVLGVRAGDVLLSMNERPLLEGQEITDAMKNAPAEVHLEWIDDLGERHEKSWRIQPAAPDGN